MEWAPRGGQTWTSKLTSELGFRRMKAMAKHRTYEADLVGRAGRKSQSPYPSRARAVNPAGVRGRLRGLPQEICAVSHRETGRTEGAARPPDRGAEVSRGHSRLLRRPKARTVPARG